MSTKTSDAMFPLINQLIKGFHSIELCIMCETNGELKGKVAIITGGSAGIGLEAAKELARKGAKIIIASRNETKLKIARNDIERQTGNPYIYYKVLDLGSLKSVRQFAENFNENRLDVLVNNAGAVALPDRLTSDGINLTMQVNFFGTFLLTYLLLPLLMSSAPSRIINGSAASMYIGEIDFDHWNDIGRYSLITSLANSKLAITLFTAELDRRFSKYGITANSYDPFLVKGTDILSNIDNGLIKNVSEFFFNLIGQKKEDVGKQISYLAAAPDLVNVSGKYFKFCGEWLNHWLTKDKPLTRKLWELSKEVVGIMPNEEFDE